MGLLVVEKPLAGYLYPPNRFNFTAQIPGQVYCELNKGLFLLITALLSDSSYRRLLIGPWVLPARSLGLFRGRIVIL